MGLLKWMGSLFEAGPRSQDRGWKKTYKRKEKNRLPTRRSLPEPTRQFSAKPPDKPPEREPVPTPVNYTEVHRTPKEVQLPPAVAAGLSRTSTEIAALQQAALGQLQQQEQMTMQQADALRHSMNQELAMITGLGQDPLQGIANTPYWQQQFGEIGKNLGPFHPYGGGLPRSPVLNKKAGK